MKNDIKQYIEKAASFLKKKISRKNEDISYYLLIVFAFIIFIIGINFFVELTESISGTSLKSYDRAVTDFIISFRTPELNIFFQYLTEVGDLYGYLILAAVFTLVFYLKFKNWRFVLEMIFVLLVSGLANVSLKQVINRARPEAVHLVSVETLSYPSGHAMSAMAFYGFLIYLFYTLKLKSWIKFVSIFLCCSIILGIGVSRIYLGVHFPSDVVGGFVAGFIWVIFCVVLFHIIDLLRKRRRNKKRKNETA